jgi:protease-4
MNDLQKALVLIGVILFLLAGVAVMMFLFGGLLFFGGERIAVIDMQGEIANSNADGYVSASMMRKLLSDAEDSDSVVAVILRINSGGGGVIESKEIAASVSKFAGKKPVVAYITDIGASGAYYVAVQSNYTMSDEDSLLGSIGVVSTYMQYKELLEEKLGINTTTIRSGEFKDIGSPYRAMTDEEKARLQEIVDKVHQEFVGVIAAKRSLSPSQLAKVTNGNIFLGSEALSLGLIDETGTFDAAVEKARQLADSPDAEVYYVDESEYRNGDLYYSIGRGVGDSLAGKMQLSDGALKFS